MNSKSLDLVDEDGLEIQALYEIQGIKLQLWQKHGHGLPITRLPVNPEAHLAYGWDIANRLARLLTKQIG